MPHHNAPGFSRAREKSRKEARERATADNEYTDTPKHKIMVALGKVGTTLLKGKIKKEAKTTMSDIAKTEDKQVMQGWLTYTSLGIGALTVIFQLMGKTFPKDEAEALVNFANSNWSDIILLVSTLTAFWGRLRREFRAKEEVAKLEAKISNTEAKK